MPDNVTIKGPLDTSGNIKVSIQNNAVSSNVNIHDSSGNNLTSAGGNLNVTVQSSTLPTGASTSANQVTQNTSLSSIVSNTSNIPTNGQKSMSASLPVVVSSDQSNLNVNVLNDPTVKITDSSGNNLNSSSGSLNVNVVGGNVGISANSAGLALDTSITTTNTKLQTLIDQNLDNGGFLWGNSGGPATGLVNGAISSVIDLTQKTSITITYMGNCSDACTISIYYSPDNTLWFKSQNVFTQALAGDFTSDTITGSGYLRAELSGVATTVDIVMAINHI